MRSGPTIASLLLLATAGIARGQALESLASQRSILPGGRAAMMGGAFTAVADDPSASYYNPAGLAFVKEDQVSLSATGYQSSELDYQNALNSQSFVQRSDTIYPNFIGGALRLGDLSLGYSFMTLDARSIYQQDKYASLSSAAGAANSYSRTYQETSTYIWAGASASLKLSEHLSFGSSLFYYQRNIEFSQNELLQLNGGALVATNGTLKTLNTGLASVNGLLWHGTAWSFGLGVKTAMSLSDHSLLLVDTVHYDPASPGQGPGGAPSPSVTSQTVRYRALDELNPNTYAAGVAWHPADFLLVSADLLVHEGIKSLYRDQGGFDLHTTTNYSVGTQLRVGPLEALGGWYTNNSMYRPPSANQTGQPAYINYQGTSAGLGADLGSVKGELGTTRQIGKGQAQIRSGDAAVQPVRATITSYTVSARVQL